MMGQSSEAALLSVRKLSKHFGGTTALEYIDVDFHAVRFTRFSARTARENPR